MKLSRLLASTVLATVVAISPNAFANTNAGGKLYVCATPQNSDLDQSEFEALTWVEVKALGSHGETGKSQNILTYDTWDTVVIQKAKGITDAGSPEIELARLASDPGQTILRAASDAGNQNYAFKLVKTDAAVVGGTPTIIYNRGIVVGPRRPNGRNEDFDLEIFTLGLNQVEIVVDAGAGGNAPVFTVLPAITDDGTPAVGETITVDDGTVTGDATITYSYRWYAGGVPIEGATANSYTLTASEVGKIMQARVVATNDSGNATAFSNATIAVVA